MKPGLSARVCVIGAGASGITAAKHLLQVGIKNIVVYEKNDQVGGNWLYSADGGHSSVYETAHIISSKKLSQYPDFPMPDEYPDYPSHKLLLDYFQSYARHFAVDEYIQFNTCVKSAEKQADDTWKITLDDGREEVFDYLLVANGHHWNPRLPDYQGTFTGEMIHSHDYRSNLPYTDKRVLVIGGGNSACDISVDISRHAAFTAISWRRGYYVIPKFMFGQPVDVVNSHLYWLPTWIRRKLYKLTWYIIVGGNKPYGLPHPDHDITAVHPLANSTLLYHLRHGDIQARPDIARFDGKTVHFVDGRQEDYDSIIAATGYQISFPFLDSKLVDFSQRDVPLYLRMFHPEHPTLAFIGLLQPQGCIWTLADTQAQVMANYIAGNCDLPANMPELIQKEIETSRKKFASAVRHSLEVEFHAYRAQLRRLLPKNAPEWSMDKMEQS